jgi:hypothetical protein
MSYRQLTHFALTRIWLCGLAAAVPASAALGHPLPDGVVMRSVQIVVHSDEILIDYQVGFNNRTLFAQLTKTGADEPLPTDDPDAALARYANELFPEIARRLSVHLEDARHNVELVKAATVERHHVRLQFTYRVAISALQTARGLLIEDGNFHDTTGYHRMAIKGQGVNIIDASVPPIVGRVRIVALDEMPESQRAAAFRISAKLLPAEP